MRTPAHARLSRGFTLVEVLVAVTILALLSTMAWRSLDSMLLTRKQLTEQADQVLALEAGLAQWGTDLDRMRETTGTTPLDWDGRVLRITRLSAGSEDQGLQVVAWALGERDGSTRWLRWQSDTVRDTSSWRNAWQTATRWSQSSDLTLRGAEVALVATSGWQLYYFRGGAWSNALSSDGTTSGTSGAADANAVGSRPPDGVRVVLDVTAPHPLAGRITRDWSSPLLSPETP